MKIVLSFFYFFLIIILVILLCTSTYNYPIIMTKCDPEINNVQIIFTIPIIKTLDNLGVIANNYDTIYDTGSLLCYISTLDVYYLTKRDQESIRYDGEIYKYEGYKCIGK